MDSSKSRSLEESKHDTVHSVADIDLQTFREVGGTLERVVLVFEKVVDILSLCCGALL